MDLKMIKKVKQCSIDGPLLEWIKNPTNDWTLPLKIVKHAVKKMS